MEESNTLNDKNIIYLNFKHNDGIIAEKKDVTQNLLYQMKNKVIRAKSECRRVNNNKFNKSQDISLKVENHNSKSPSANNNNNNKNACIPQSAIIKAKKINRTNSCSIYKSRMSRYSMKRSSSDFFGGTNTNTNTKFFDKDNENSQKEINNSCHYQREMFSTKYENKKKFLMNIQPLQAARTIYKELSRQKSAFYHRIKLNETPIQKSKASQAEQVNTRLTCLLNRKDKSELPTVLPVYLSLHNTYNSISEKMRHEKIMEKLIQLKAFIIKNPNNASAYIKEFLLRNGIINSEYFSWKSIANFQSFLDNKFNINSKRSLQDILIEALTNSNNNRQEDFKGKYNLLEESCVIDQVNNSQQQHNSNQEQLKKKSISSDLKKKQSNESASVNTVDHEKLYGILDKNSKKKDLKGLVEELEEEFANIQLEDKRKIEKMRKVWLIPQKKKLPIEKNIYVPNLCLSSSLMNKNIIKKLKKEKEKRMQRNIKQNQIIKINNRLYYSNYNKYNNMNIDGLKRKNKLTEYIMLEKSRKELFIEQQTNKMK